MAHPLINHPLTLSKWTTICPMDGHYNMITKESGINYKYPNIEEKCGTFTVDETNTSGKSHDIIRSNQKLYMIRAVCRVAYDLETWNRLSLDSVCDPVQGIWTEESAILVKIGGFVYSKCYLTCNPLIQKMLDGSSFKLSIERNDDTVTLEVPIYIHELQDGHVFVLQQIHSIQFECNLKSLYRATPKVTFLCTYLNTVDPSFFPGPTDMVRINEQIVYKKQMVKQVLNVTDNLSCTLRPNFYRASMGIYFFIFDNMGRPVYDTKLLSSVCLNFSLNFKIYEVLNIEDPRTILGKSAQFPENVDKFEDERIREISQTRVDTLQSRPVVFPVEVWARIFYYTTAECVVSLMSSCKFLFKTSRQPTILSFLYRRFNYLKGWYCLPFNDNKIYDYALNNCINFSMLDEIILKLTFSRRIPHEYTICISTITYNILRTMHGMKGLAFSN